METVSLRGKRIEFCRGCLACQSGATCPLHDDAAAIVERIVAADAVAFATPIYFYEMAGQMKTLLDRTNPAFPAKPAFRDVYLLATATRTSGPSTERSRDCKAGSTASIRRDSWEQ